MICRLVRHVHHCRYALMESYDRRILLATAFLIVLILVKAKAFNCRLKQSRKGQIYIAAKGFKSQQNHQTQNLSTTIASRIPYYVYTGGPYDVIQNCLDSGQKLALDAHQKFFHGDDVIWSKLILEDSWRTTNKSLAKIFIVPGLIGLRAELNYIKCGNRNQHQILDDIASKILIEPTFIKSGGRDHLMVSSHFKIRNNKTWKLFSPKVSTMLKNMTFGNFELVDSYRYWDEQWKCTVVVPYVDNSLGTELDLDFEKDWKSRHFDFLFMGGLDKRKGYGTRRKLSNYRGVRAIWEHSRLGSMKVLTVKTPKNSSFHAQISGSKN